MEDERTPDKHTWFFERLYTKAPSGQKYPHCQALVKEKGIAIECCPIANVGGKKVSSFEGVPNKLLENFQGTRYPLWQGFDFTDQAPFLGAWSFSNRHAPTSIMSIRCLGAWAKVKSKPWLWEHPIKTFLENGLKVSLNQILSFMMHLEYLDFSFRDSGDEKEPDSDNFMVSGNLETGPSNPIHCSYDFHGLIHLLP